MINVPMQLTEEKKSTRRSSDGFVMCCEKCVFGSGVHTCSAESNTKEDDSK